ncbi:MAG: type II secretion system secretin GspD [Burkholderiaceae bacterium]
MTRMPPARFQRLPTAIVLIAGLAAFSGAAALFPSDSWAQKRGVTKQQQQPQPQRTEPVTLNFENADITAVARTMSSITGRNVVVDPRVKGTITLGTDRPVSPAVAYNQFLAALRLQGFTVVQADGLDKVVPEADAKLQAGSVSIGGNAPNVTGNQIVTQIFRLNHENANNLVPVLRPLISPNNTINVNPGNNSLVITDYADNLRRLGRIISSMDVANATDVEVIPLEHAIASDLAPLLLRLIESGSGVPGAPVGIPGQPGGDATFRTTILPEPRSNALIVRAANPARLALVRSLVAKLDRPSMVGEAGPAGNIHVVYLKNADSVKLAATLRAAIAAGNTTGVGGVGGALPGGGATQGMQTALSTGLQIGGAGGLGSASGPTLNSAQANQPSTGGQIQADPSTNSLIITAPEPQFRQIRAVIDKLDSRRAQVFIESLIAEVNMDNAADFGIQWQSLLGKGGSTVGVIGTNYGAGGSNIITLASQFANTKSGFPTNPVAPPAGFNFGLAQKIGGVYALGALANFLQSTGNGNVLSTPNLLTLDNEEARIVIGQNVPFVTGQFTTGAAGAGGAVNPFQTIERKDVGLTLRVKPQISEDGSVKLVIYQEVSSVLASSVNSSTGLITNKRSIESSVVVDDGAIVVLGGLLQDEYSANVDKVPGLGDVPILGNLFKSESRTRRKSNLMVFLRPVVVRDASSVEQLSMDRYDLMRAGQLAAQPAPSSVLRINEAAVLPQQPAPRLSDNPTGTTPKTRPLAQPPQDWWRDAPTRQQQADPPPNPNIIRSNNLGMTPY